VSADRDGRTALVLGVPVERCASCGETTFSDAVASRLDVMLRELLASPAEVSQQHWDVTPSAAVAS
jgi:hypothetical protein